MLNQCLMGITNRKLCAACSAEDCSYMDKVEYKITMPYLGGILTDNNYKYATRRTKPIVRLWKKELAGKAQALNIPQADSYKIEVYGKFTDERRPDIPNLFKVIGDGLKRTKDYFGLGVDDKHFRLKDVGYELGHLDPEIEIIIKPIADSIVKVFQEELNDRTISDDRLGRLGLRRREDELTNLNR